MASKNQTDPFNIGTMAGSNVGLPGPNTGGLTARARPNEPAIGPPAGPKPPDRSPAGNPPPVEDIPAIGVVAGEADPGSQDMLGDAVGSYVLQQFTRMRSDRNLTDELLLRCLYARKSEYTPQELALLSSGDETNAATAALLHTYFPITGTKCRAGEAWIADIFKGTEGRLYTLSPTPIPNAPTYIKDMVVQQVKKEISQFRPVNEQEVRDRIKELRDIAMTHMQTAAKQAANRMAQKIEDQLDECNFDKTISEFCSDVLTFPYAVLKGPIIKNVPMLQWDSDRPVVKVTPSLTVERVSPFDYYYSQFATSPQEGNIIELMHMTRAALYGCIGLKNFKEDKIRQVLASYPTGYKVLTQTTTERQQLERNTTNTYDDNELIDTFDFWGSIPGKLLREWGLSKGVSDDEESYEVNAWVVNGICMRVVLNPDPLKKRPYYVTSYEKVPGALVGRCVPMLMEANQQIINSAYRALRRNMGLSSGPFAEVDISRLGGQQAPNEIRPAMVKPVEPDLTGGNSPAYRFHDIHSHAQELEATIDAEIKKCDDVTGIPAYSYGNAAVSGAGRTVGGLAMLMGNASKGIKKVISNIEYDVLQPLITTLYNYNMMYDPDTTIKVDAQIVAHGPTGVILKEAQVQRRMEALQVLGPYVPTGIIPKDGLTNLLRQILGGLDLEVDDILPDPKQAAQLQQLAQQTGQQPPVNGPPGSPMESLTGPLPEGGAPAPGGPPQGNVTPMRGGGGKGGHPGVPPGVHPLIPHGLPPAVPGAMPGVPQAQPAPPMGGTQPQIMPDGRSGPAAGVVQAMNRGRL